MSNNRTIQSANPPKYKCDQGLLLCYAVRYLKARKSRLCLLLSRILTFFKKVKVIVKHKFFFVCSF